MAETPSLARAIADLLESGGLEVTVVPDVLEASPTDRLSERFRLVVVACNAAYCATVRRWIRGELPGATLVVVGSRDPVLAGLEGITALPLPIEPWRLLATIEGLVDDRAARALPSLRPLAV